MAKPALIDAFARGYVIHLPSRVDRQRRVLCELAAHGMTPSPGRLELYPAVRPADPDGFASIGMRGCFLSHRGALARALQDGLSEVLILEDDVVFDGRLLTDGRSIVEQIRSVPWDILYLGHHLEVTGFAAQAPVSFVYLPWSTSLAQAHCYAVRGSVLPSLVAYLDLVLTRPEGHPEGGRCDFDGALSMYRAKHPELKTLAALPRLASQASSRSDIRPGLVDRIAGLREMASVARCVLRRRK